MFPLGQGHNLFLSTFKNKKFGYINFNYYICLMNYKELILSNFKKRTLKEKQLTISLGEELIELFNSKLKTMTLNEAGEIEFMKNFIAYGYDEILECVNIVFEKYNHEDDKEIYKKFCGIIYNRNEKKCLEYI